MPEFIRVRDKDTNHELSVPEGTDLSPYEVVDLEPGDPGFYGDYVPPKHHVDEEPAEAATDKPGDEKAPSLRVRKPSALAEPTPTPSTPSGQTAEKES